MRGLIMPSMVVSIAHTDDVIDSTIERIGEALTVYKRALDEGIAKYLPVPSVKPVLRKYN
jgi:glutamate-1-semialdehyde 2,1-aminomutase